MTACRMDRPSKVVYIGLGAVLLAGVVARVLCLRFFADPHTVDSIYCIDVARNICEGRGLVIDYAWVYARGVPESLPMPSHGYWNPGHTFFLVPWMAVLGTTYQVAQIACICLSIPFTAIMCALLVARSLTVLGPRVLTHHVWSTRFPYVESASGLRGVLERDLGDGPIFTDDSWRISGLVDRPVLQIPSDGQETMLRVARQVGVRHAVMRGASLRYCPGLREAIDGGDVEVLELIDTAPRHEGVHVIDLFPE